VEIVEKYSHLNGEEYLIVHHNDTYEEIKEVICTIDANEFKTRVSKEGGKIGKLLYNPDELNREFKRLFRQKDWKDTRYPYHITTDYSLMQELINLSMEEQKELFIEKGLQSPLRSYKQIDFVKNDIAVEVQFGRCSFVAYDLFVKHLLFYSSGIINVGIEILPMKTMQAQMSSGVAYYEGEVYNVLRHGRNSLPVPLLIMGIAPCKKTELEEH